MSKSYAEIATEWQETGNFPGHDIYQNGIINKDCNRLYIAGWQDNWANASWTDFVFENSKLCFINLIPIIENINVPNYPCEEYQNLKKEYNINLLKKTYGEDYAIKGNKIEWKCSSYAISVETIENGKNRYTGGNIKIILERI